MARAELLLIDNRDSFTWNLAQGFERLGTRVQVVRGAELEPERILRDGRITHVVAGPGPGTPAGTLGVRRTLELLRGRLPWLGVCLGHQVLAESLGAKVVPTGAPVHGKRDAIDHDRIGIFRDLPRPFVAARYHSLAIDPDTLPPGLRACAWSLGPDGHRAGGTIQGIGIPGEATWGVQFHPESFMTPEGERLLASFLEGVPCPLEERVEEGGGR
ncbi:MAG: anthranilate synthase component II [Planctomycetota bacterium]|jgi:anthranilate synthase/aminodeoxychorismate synthase-like glutamine amidotransferase